MHEAEQMVARHDRRKLRVIPIKIHPRTDDLPAFLASIQYLNLARFADPDDLTKHLVGLLEGP